jgi:hypothetical protein
MSGHARRSIRIETNEACTIAREDGGSAGGMLVDVSDEGFCVEISHALHVGERIDVDVAGAGRISGIVRWFDRCRAGAVLAPYSRGACDIC